MTDVDQHQASERMEQIVSSILIGYRLTIGGGTTVELMPWHRDPSQHRTP